MGFGASRYERTESDKRWNVHPIWRGIGCILLLIVPFLSFILARVFLASVHFLPIPESLMKPVVFSYYETDFLDGIVYRINDFLNGRLLYGELFFTVIFIFIGFGVISIIYGVFYRMFGPPRYGPLDEPPLRKSDRRRR